MAGEFLGQDYLNAAASFGSNIGSGVLSTLGGAASTATGLATDVLGASYNYGAGTGNYLSNLTQQLPQASESFFKNNQPAGSNSNLGSFGQNFNMNALTSGFGSIGGGVGNQFNNLGSSFNNFSGNFGGSLGNLFGTPSTNSQQSFTGLQSQSPTQPLTQLTPSSQNMQNEYNKMVSTSAQTSPLDLLKPLADTGMSSLGGAASKAQSYGGGILGTVSDIWNTPVISKANAAETSNIDIKTFNGQSFNDVYGTSKAAPTSNGIPSSNGSPTFDSVASGIIGSLFGGSKTSDNKSTVSTLPLVNFKKKEEVSTTSTDFIPTSRVNINGGADYTNKIISDVPVVDGKPINNPTDSKGNIVIGMQLSKPDEEYMKANEKRWFSDIGDQPSRDLIGQSVTDTWSDIDKTTGKPIPHSYTIGSLPEALEYRKQAALHGLLNTEATTKGQSQASMADFYSNELDKYMQNNVTLSSTTHHLMKDSGESFKNNPWENAGDVALAFLKGGGRDNLGVNYNFNKDVSDIKTGIINLLPGGKGLNETRWDAALSPDKAKEILSGDFRPAIMSVLASEGSKGPYGMLSGTGSAQAISKLPEAYQKALDNISKGIPEKQTVSQTVYGTLQEGASGFILKDIARPTSYDIPSWFKQVPESKEGIINYNPNGDMADAATQKKLDTTKEVKLYIPYGKDKDGNPTNMEITGKVIVNEDTGGLTYYQRHIDPSTGKPTSLYQIVGGAGQNAGQSGEFQFATPTSSTVYNQQGQQLDVSKFNLPTQMHYTPLQQATINTALETIYSNPGGSRETKFVENQRAASAYEQLRTMGIDSDRVVALINARKTGNVPLEGYSPLNVINMVHSNAVRPEVSEPWTFPSGSNYETGLTPEIRASSPVLITNNRIASMMGVNGIGGGQYATPADTSKPGYAIKNVEGLWHNIGVDAGNLGNGVAGNTALGATGSTTPGEGKERYEYVSSLGQGTLADLGKFANNYRLPGVEIPLSTSETPLLNNKSNDIVGGEVTRPAGYTGSPPVPNTMQELVFNPGSVPGTSKGQQEIIGTALEQMRQNPVGSQAYDTYRNQLIKMGVKNDNLITNMDLLRNNQITQGEAAKSLVLDVTTEKAVNPSFTVQTSKPNGQFAIPDFMKLGQILTPSASAAETDIGITYANGEPVTPESLGVKSPDKNNIYESARSLFAQTPLGAYLVGTPEEKIKGESTRQRIDQYTNVLGVGMIGGPSASKAANVINSAELFSSSAPSIIERIPLTSRVAGPALSEVRMPGIHELTYSTGRPLGAIPLTKGANIYDIGAGVMMLKGLLGGGSTSKSDQVSNSGSENIYNSGGEDVYEAPIIPSLQIKPSLVTPQYQSPSLQISQPIEQLPSQKMYIMDDNFRQKQALTDSINSQNGDIINTQNKLLAAGVIAYDNNGKLISKVDQNTNGFNYKYDESNTAQKDLRDELTGQSAIINRDIKTANNIKLTESTSEGADKGLWNNTNDWIGTNIVKKVIPDFETVGGSMIDTYQGALQSKGLSLLPAVLPIPKQQYDKFLSDSNIVDTTTHMNNDGTMTYSGKDQMRGYLSGDKGAQISFIDKTTGLPVMSTIKYANRPTIDLTGWMDTIQQAGAPQGTTPERKISEIIPMKIDPVVAMNSYWNMPREKPLEAAMWYAMPLGLGVGEGIGANVLARGLASKSPLAYGISSRLAQSTLLPSLYKGGSYALMGNMGAQEALKVPGYSFDPLAPAFGKNIISRTIEGYDQSGKPIYASQSTEDTSKRMGELGFVAASGAAGAMTASGIRTGVREGVQNLPTIKPGETVGQAMTRDKLGLVERGEAGLSKILDVAFDTSQWKNAGQVFKAPTPEGVLSGKVPVRVQNTIDTARITQPGAENAIPAFAEAGIKAKGGITQLEHTLPYSDINTGKVLSYSRDPKTGNLIKSVTADMARATDKSTTTDYDIILSSRKDNYKQLEQVASNLAGVKEREMNSGGQKVKVEGTPVYKESWNSPTFTRLLGERNPESFSGINYKITDATGKITTKFEPMEADVKISGQNQVLGDTESRLPFWGMVREPASVGSIPSLGIGTALFGRPTLKQETTYEYTPMGLRHGDKPSMGNIEAARASTRMRDQADNLQTIAQTGTRGGKDWNEKIPEVGKIAASMKRDATYLRDAYNNDVLTVKTDLSSGKISKPEADTKLNNLKIKDKEISKYEDYVNKDVLDGEWNLRMTKDGKVEKVNMRDLAQKSADENTIKLDNLIQKRNQPPTTRSSYVSASAPFKPSGISSSIVSGGLISSIINPSTISSISSPSPKPSSPPPGSPKPSSSSPPSSSGSPSGSSGGSSGSSSYFSSSSSSYSNSPSSSPSSSQSSSSMSSIGRGGGWIGGGSPFLAPPGGGGGGSGGGGHMNAIIKNPLAGLSVAGSGNQFMKFDSINNFVRSVKGNTGNINPNVVGVLQTPSQAGNTKIMSSGSKSSLEEAISLPMNRSVTARTSKKQKVKVKRKIDDIKIPEINLKLKSIGNLSLKSPKKSKKGRYK